MILKPKSCSFPLQRYGCCKNHFCIHVNGDVNLDKLVHENMFYSVITGYPKSGHNYGAPGISDHTAVNSLWFFTEFIRES